MDTLVSRRGEGVYVIIIIIIITEVITSLMFTNDSSYLLTTSGDRLVIISGLYSFYLLVAVSLFGD